MTDRLTLFDPSPLTRHRRPDRPMIHDVGSTVPTIPPVDPRTLARTSDQETSKAGARSVQYRAGSQKAKLLAAYVAAGRPITDAEAADAAGLLAKPGCCWWHRCSDLRADGMLEVVGTGVSPVTGESVMMCRPTALGTAAAGKVS